MTFTLPTKELKRAVDLLAHHAGADGYVALSLYGATAVADGVHISLKWGETFGNPAPAIVAAKPLQAIFKGSGTGKIKTETLDLSWDKEHVTLKAGRSRFKLTRFSEHCVPVVAAPDTDIPALPMRVAAFEMLLDRVGYAAAASKFELNARPMLQGVHLHSEDGKLVSVATDGHRLARYAVSADADVPVYLTIGNAAVSAIRKFLDFAKKDADLSFVADTDRAMLRTEYGSITFTLIDCSFPDYKRLIPDMDRGMEMDTIAFAKAIDSMLWAVPYDKKIMATFDLEGEMNLFAEFGAAKAETILDYEGASAVSKAVFNGQYMMQALAPCECKVQFDAEKPILLKGLCDTEYVALIMPMRS